MMERAAGMWSDLGSCIETRSIACHDPKVQRGSLPPCEQQFLGFGAFDPLWGIFKIKAFRQNVVGVVPSSILLS